MRGLALTFAVMAFLAAPHGFGTPPGPFADVWRGVSVVSLVFAALAAATTLGTRSA